MSGKVHKIHSLQDDAPWDTPVPPFGSPEHPLAVRGIDRVLGLQRPVVVAHIRSVRLRHPEADAAELVRILERRYLAAITVGGSAVGATAVIPGIGTGMTLALSGIETAGFLESTALFAQSVAEVHGIAVDDPDRGRALVMTLMLGQEGVDLVAQLAKQATGQGGRAAYWGELITRTLPRAAVAPLADRLKGAFLHQFAVRGGASFLGKALPFGIGAAVGGAGNHILGRRVLRTSRRAFGAPPAELPAELEPRAGAERVEARMLRGAKLAGNAVAGAAGTVGRGAVVVGRGVGHGAGAVGRGVAAVRRGVGQGVGAVGRGAGAVARDAGRGVGHGVGAVGRGAGAVARDAGTAVAKGVGSAGRSAGTFLLRRKPEGPAADGSDSADRRDDADAAGGRPRSAP